MIRSEKLFRSILLDLIIIYQHVPYKRRDNILFSIIIKKASEVSFITHSEQNGPLEKISKKKQKKASRLIKQVSHLTSVLKDTNYIKEELANAYIKSCNQVLEKLINQVEII